jgi:3-methylfumaryl-CoA hydratase
MTDTPSSAPFADSAAPLCADPYAHLQQWEGRRETRYDDITAAPLRGWCALLDRTDVWPDALPNVRSTVPPLGHWLYFLPTTAQSGLGEDGHARRGGFLPPVPLPRRMWAGGRLTWNLDNPLRVGDAARRESRIASVRHKAGRSGSLVFVEVEHAIHNAAGLCLTEVHDIVYRAAPQPGGDSPPSHSPSMPPPIPAPSGMAWQRQQIPDAVALFRYSALTFNGHRIHYDRSYATQVEGYPGLVVHGPYIATLLLDLLHRQQPQARVAAFGFRALRPTFDLHPFSLMGQPTADGSAVALCSADHEGWLTMQADVRLA